MVRDMLAAVATDIDGTLFGEDSTVSPFTALVLDRTIAAGIHIIPVTARRPSTTFSTVPWATHAVCLNGGLVVDHAGKVIQEQFLLADLTDVVLGRITDRLDVGFAACAGDQLMGDRRYAELRGTNARGSWTEIDSPDELRPHRIHYVSVRSQHLDSDQLANEITNLCSTVPVSVRVASPSVVDLVPLGVSKSTGVAAAATHLGIEPTFVVAYGDMPNDLGLLSWAGLGVAVADGHPDLIAAADEVTGPAAHNGVAIHLQSLLPPNARQSGH